MRFKLSNRFDKIKESKVAQDSFWAVFGNGLGMALLLLAGIIIARFLGKDVYGEYGVVKTNMFYLAGFSTFGLGLTSTRFIARYLKVDKTQIIGIINTSTKITFVFSSFVAVALVIFSNRLALYLGEPNMATPFRVLSIIIVIKALCTTSNGILGGLGEYKSIARSAIISGATMLLLSVPLTYYYGLCGSLLSLTVSQLVNTGINYIIIQHKKKVFPLYHKAFSSRELISFSFPIAMQEISYAICNWIGILALTKYSTLGEVGIYSATAQWNAIIMFLPSLLSNVVLSHLSGTIEKSSHASKIRRLLTVYLICTLIPFIIVYCLSPIISSFYGSQFIGMNDVLRMLTFVAIPLCCSDVFKSELLASGHPWLLFSIRFCKDILFMSMVVFSLRTFTSCGGALLYAINSLIISFLFLLSLFISYRIVSQRTKL